MNILITHNVCGSKVLLMLLTLVINFYDSIEHLENFHDYGVFLVNEFLNEKSLIIAKGELHSDVNDSEGRHSSTGMSLE